jgi:hypothetical protein
MTRFLSFVFLTGLAWSASSQASTPGPAPTRRFALVVGANRGAADRVPLRYAISDAERFAELVAQMGGVQAADQTVLRDPTREALVQALAQTRERVGRAKAESARVEVIVYFSGHADDRGLMLGRELLPYRELRDAIHSVGADVGITILDACASGAITRLKGGRSLPAFLTDVSQVAQGYAFLTSSSEDEAAQESERLGGSFFTHALLTGLRGGADASSDGRVTLNEAYQFAFHETLAQTTSTEGGAQHPTYDIKMAGTGDVVMTEVRQNSSSLILGTDYDGRFFVLGPKRQLVAELYKPYGRQVELGLEPGEYHVYFEQEKKLLSTSFKLGDGQRQELVREDLRQARRVPTRSRGGDAGEDGDLLDGRVRVEAGWNTRFTFLHWLRPDLGLQLTYGDRTFGADRTVLAGARYYLPISGRVRPHAGLSVGRYDIPVWGAIPGPPDEPFPRIYGIIDHRAEVGLATEVGLDLYVGRHFNVSLTSQGSFAGGLSQIDTWVGLGWTFGGPKTKKK